MPIKKRRNEMNPVCYWDGQPNNRGSFHSVYFSSLYCYSNSLKYPANLTKIG